MSMTKHRDASHADVGRPDKSRDIDPSNNSKSNIIPSTIRSLPSWRLPCLVTLIVFVIYQSTVYPSVTGGDSGELIITTCNLGIAHPPGYPTYTMLGWAWLQLTNLIPTMSTWQKAYRINSLCATFGAIAAGVIAWATAALAQRYESDNNDDRAYWTCFGSSIVGFCSGVGFALMPTPWLYSIQGEVFALNNLLCAILIALTVRYYHIEEQIESEQARIGLNKKFGEGKDTPAQVHTSVNSVSTIPILQPQALIPIAYLGAFVCGVCLTNQHTTVFPVIVTSGFISWSLHKKGLLTLRRILMLILMVLIGMLPYCYLFIRSHWRVIDSWGDQRTWRGLMKHLLREEYGTFQLAASEISQDPGMWSRLKVYGENMKSEMMIITPIVGVIGLVSTIRSSSGTRRTNLVLLFSYLFYVLVFHKLANLDLRPLFLGVQARFWQQANIIIWIWAGIGIQFCSDHIQRGVYGKVMTKSKSVHRNENSTPMTTSKFPLSTVLSLVYTLTFLTLQLYSQYPIHDHHLNDSFYTSGVAMLKSFPKDSIVLLNGDLNNNMIKYPQQCEGIRPDVSLVSLQLMSWEWFVPIQSSNYPRVIFPGNQYHVSVPGSFNIRQFIQANIAQKKKKGTARGGVFLCGPWKDGDFSNIRTKQPTETFHYELHPYGLCNQLLPHGSTPKNMSSFLRRGWSGMPPLTSLPPFETWKYGEETWEMVLYKDLLSRLTYLTSYASFHSNKDMSDIHLLKLAYDFTESMRLNSNLLRHFELMNSYEYRSAGVIYGLYSKYLYSRGPSHRQEADSVGRRMYYAWYEYVRLQPNDSEIRTPVIEKVNPYAGQRIVGLEDEEEYRNLPPLTQPNPTPNPTPAPAAKKTSKKATKKKGTPRKN